MNKRKFKRCQKYFLKTFKFTWVVLAVFAMLMLVKPVGATVITNSSFETGNFSGWVTQDILTPLFALQVNSAGFTTGFGLFTSAPTNGSFAALHGFDGDGPGTIRIGQDITVTSALPVVNFDYRVGWDMLNIAQNSTAARLFDVNVEVSGGGANLASTNILTAAPLSINLDTGNLTGSVDLSAFITQNVRLSFDFFIPETFTGPAFFQLDNITTAANGVPEPATMTLLGIGLVGLVGASARRKLKKKAVVNS